MEKTAGLREVLDVANAHFDGHLTLLKFTTNWRCSLGTIDMDEREAIEEMSVGKTLEDACAKELKKFYGKKVTKG